MATPDTSANQSTLDPQALATLVQLLQSSQNNQPAMSMTNGGVGNAQGQQIGSYQKGVQKALQEQGYAHTNQAIQQGIPPDFIQNHPLATGQPQQQPPMSTPQGVNPAGAQALQQNPQQILQGLVQNNKGNESGASANPNDTNNTIQQLLQNVVSQKPGILGSIFRGTFEENKAKQISNLGSAQKLAAGQPAEIALPQAQAGEATARSGYVGSLNKQVQQAIEGETPLQPVDLANITGNINTLNLNSLKDASEKINNDIKNAQDISEFHQKTLNLMGRVGGWFSNSGETVATGAKEAQDYIKKLQTAKAKVDAKIAGFTPTNYASQYKYKDITPEMAAKELELRKAAGG